MGRPTDAIRALHVHRRTVRDTVGLEPTSALAELEARLLADATEEPSGKQPGNLRLPTRSFLGRASDVRVVGELLSSGRIVTLVGVGGVGKTALAVRAAGGLRHRYRDGVWFCELADIESGDSIVDALAGALGVRQQRGRSLVASIAAAFADADALLVIDNCEHVLESAAAIIRVLTLDCPTISVLATSRERLGLSGERVHPVGPLTISEARGEASEGAAFELFIERAREAGVRLDLDQPTRTAVGETCRLLDGLPLGIELAAARARTMSVQEMSVRLDERFRILAHNNEDRPRRQQTLWDVVDWSYQLLDASDRALFCQLSVFLGGFTVEAAAAISGRPPEEVEDVVWSLVERSLLHATTGSERTRYQMLETIRRYAQRQLDTFGGADQIRAAHLRYFVDLAIDASHGLRSSEEARHCTRIREELANLRAAHQHAIDQRDIEAGARLVAALHEYAEWRQFFELGTWAASTLELDVVSTGLAPELHAIAGWSRCIAGDFHAALDMPTAARR